MDTEFDSIKVFEINNNNINYYMAIIPPITVNE